MGALGKLLQRLLSRDKQPAAVDAPWVLSCTLLRPLRISRFRTARAGADVTLPAPQAIALHRAGKARLHLEVLSVPDALGATPKSDPWPGW